MRRVVVHYLSNHIMASSICGMRAASVGFISVARPFFFFLLPSYMKAASRYRPAAGITFEARCTRDFPHFSSEGFGLAMSTVSAIMKVLVIKTAATAAAFSFLWQFTLGEHESDWPTAGLDYALTVFPGSCVTL